MRQYIKPTLFATMLLIAVFAPRSGALGQSNGHFEWAKGFGTSNATEEYGCSIAGTVTDSSGNLYILGKFRNDSEWGTGWTAERLLPMAPHGPWPDNINTIIAKISPEGDMVWKKVIHSNNGTPNYPMDIKKVGDTAFACLVQVALPTGDHYTYYLDTLIPGRSDYPINSMYLEDSYRTTFLMFDFDGNVIEQHFLYLTFTDTVGNDIVNYYNYNTDPMPWFSSQPYQFASFDVDNDGNVFISRVANDFLDDSLNVSNGTIHSLKFWVDERQVGECATGDMPLDWYPQILKFSPHFDTLLASRYVVQESGNVEYIPYSTRTFISKNNELFFLNTLNMVGNHENLMILDSISNISITHSDMSTIIAYLVKYDSELTAQWVIALNDSIINMSNSPSMTQFHDISIDSDSNLLFISASTSRGTASDTINFHSILTYHGTQLSLKNNMFFMSFKMGESESTPELYSYGNVPSIFISDGTTNMSGNLVCNKNRIYMQSRYMGGLQSSLGIGNIQFDNKYSRGIGLIIFDYNGKVINNIDYAAISPNNHPGPISLVDSSLYISGVLTSEATFGDIHFYLQGNSQSAYLAKYVDTSFMTPYTGDTGDVNISIVPDVGVFTAYPNPFRQRVNIKIENSVLKDVNGTVTATLTDITGRSEEVQLSVEGDGRYVLDLTARPQASYLLTLTTDDGRQHTVHLLKQSDRFGTD